MKPRFTHVRNVDMNDRDAPLDWTLRHIEQLAPVFAEYSEVLDHRRAGSSDAGARCTAPRKAM